MNVSTITSHKLHHSQCSTPSQKGADGKGEAAPSEGAEGRVTAIQRLGVGFGHRGHDGDGHHVQDV